MSLKRSFWWGKLTGLLAGSVGGASGLALSIFAEALLNGRLLTESDWFWQMMIYGFVGLFAGAFCGALVGTVLGVLIAWTHLDELAVSIWFFTGSGMPVAFSFFWSAAGCPCSNLPCSSSSSSGVAS